MQFLLSIQSKADSRNLKKDLVGAQKVNGEVVSMICLDSTLNRLKLNELLRFFFYKILKIKKICDAKVTKKSKILLKFILLQFHPAVNVHATLQINLTKFLNKIF